MPPLGAKEPPIPLGFIEELVESKTDGSPVTFGVLDMLQLAGRLLPTHAKLAIYVPERRRDGVTVKLVIELGLLVIMEIAWHAFPTRLKPGLQLVTIHAPQLLPFQVCVPLPFVTLHACVFGTQLFPEM
jgi:hypothetical protein